MENQDKPPETFADLSPERQRVWASLQETQLFLRQLEADRDNVQDRLDVACEPGDGKGELRVALRAERYRIDYCINTIRTARG